MNTSCPKHSVEDLETALQQFQGGSFLTHHINRDENGLLSKQQFMVLLRRAYKRGDYIKYNAYSFYQMASTVNREYCFCLERFVFFQKLYAHTNTPEYKVKAAMMEQKVKDLLTCIDYMEKMQINGDESIMVNPTKERRPLSYSDPRIELEAMTDIALQNDMLNYSIEKNRAARNLLTLYGFLNLTAVGMLLYIYRSK